MHRSPNLAGSQQPPARKSALQSRSTQLFAFRFGWVVLVIWYEVGEVFRSLSSCRFPDSALRKLSGQDPTHVVLLADPHVPHPRLSHPHDGRPWVNALYQIMEEVFMRKSWHVVRRLGRIDAVIVAGDMLDGGRAAMSDNEYREYVKIFKSIFTLPSGTPMHFVPGNHDIPLVGPHELDYSDHARRRYAEYFGDPNTVLPIGNHSFVMLDSIGLAGEDYQRYASEVQYGEWDGIEGGVSEFIRSVGERNYPAPILVTHIPLARPESASCGPLRERGRIRKGVGPGYQNLLGVETSRYLLETIRPKIVFSGDDHDYCDITHPGHIREVTIKSFSAQAGVRRPGFQLLSLVPPRPGQTSLSDRPCSLPDQDGVYSYVYAPVAILTLAFLLFTNIRKAWSNRSGSPTTTHKRSEKETFSKDSHSRFTRQPTLPTRRSAQHLTMTVPRERHQATLSPAPSNPTSPLHSPRLAPYDEETELGVSPPLSRRSSYGADLTDDKRTTSGLFATPRRAQRILTASDWAAAARAKDVSVLSLVVDSKGPLGRLRAFVKWLRRSRNSVLGKTGREFATIAIPALIVWVCTNALFLRWD